MRKSFTSTSSATPRKSILKNSSEPKKLQPESLFPTTKQDKRLIKHAQLMSKVAKSAAPKPRRRRPNKKLVTTLDALADALPDDETADTTGPSGSRPEDQVNVIKRKSVKSKPGAMKRREALDKTERDRFAKNLAQMAGKSNDNATSSQTALPPKTEDRWKALRGFIAQTMEKKPEISATR